jgi:hypothetical protein
VKSKLPILLGFVAAASLVVAFLQWRAKERLAEETAQLRSALEPAEATSPAPPPRNVDSETDADAADKLELLRLRNEVRQLREGAKELDKLRAELAASKVENSGLRAAQAGGQSPSTNAPGLVTRQDWRFVGYSSPEATLQSFTYAMGSGDFDAFLAALAPADRELFMNNSQMTKEKFAAEAAQGAEKMVGYRILGRDPASTDEKVILAIEVLEADGKSKQQPLTFIRDGQEWRMSQEGRKQRNRTPSQ